MNLEQINRVVVNRSIYGTIICFDIYNDKNSLIRRIKPPNHIRDWYLIIKVFSHIDRHKKEFHHEKPDSSCLSWYKTNPTSPYYYYPPTHIKL